MESTPHPKKLTTLKCYPAIHTYMYNCTYIHYIHTYIHIYIQTYNTYINTNIHFFLTYINTNIHRFSHQYRSHPACLKIKQLSINCLGPVLWNSLPEVIRKSPSMGSFKLSVKKFIIFDKY